MSSSGGDDRRDGGRPQQPAETLHRLGGLLQDRLQSVPDVIARGARQWGNAAEEKLTDMRRDNEEDAVHGTEQTRRAAATLRELGDDADNERVIDALDTLTDALTGFANQQAEAGNAAFEKITRFRCKTLIKRGLPEGRWTEETVMNSPMRVLGPENAQLVASYLAQATEPLTGLRRSRVTSKDRAAAQVQRGNQGYATMDYSTMREAAETLRRLRGRGNNDKERAQYHAAVVAVGTGLLTYTRQRAADGETGFADLSLSQCTSLVRHGLPGYTWTKNDVLKSSLAVVGSDNAAAVAEFLSYATASPGQKLPNETARVAVSPEVRTPASTAPAADVRQRTRSSVADQHGTAAAPSSGEPIEATRQVARSEPARGEHQRAGAQSTATGEAAVSNLAARLGSLKDRLTERDAAGDGTMQREESVPTRASANGERFSGDSGASSQQWIFADHTDFEDASEVAEIDVISHEGSLIYRWATGVDEPRLFRVLVSDDLDDFPHPAPYVRTAGVVGPTAAAVMDLLDPAKITSATRYITVWSYAPPDSGSLVTSRPVLVAEKKFVCPVVVEKIESVGGQVAASWRRLSGAARTNVYRWEALEYSRAVRNHAVTDPSRLLPVVHESGFLDTGVQRDKAYTYVMVNEVRHRDLDGRAIVLDSPRVVRPVEIPALLQSVTSLEVTQRHENGVELCDLTWTSVAGDTVIYRTSTYPSQDLAREAELTEGHLAGQGLSETTRLPNPPVDQDGITTVSSVPWLDGLEHMYFTPVTRGTGGGIAVGATRAVTRTPQIADVRLVQRTTWQLLTFEWPGNAYGVALLDGERGAPLGPGRPALAQIMRDDYRRAGGFVLDLDLSTPRTLHLVPYSYQDGREVYGTTSTALDVDRFEPFDYELRIERVGALRRRTAVWVTYRGNSGFSPQVPIALLAHPHRVPLAPPPEDRGARFVAIAAPEEDSSPGQYITLPSLVADEPVLVAVSEEKLSLENCALIPLLDVEDLDTVSFVRREPDRARWGGVF